ncbi:hypothetical protein glysoja_045792 [Glycine soja]|uniref:Uncharacterized protein n=1 Tax=Glycine soja TaxID=3848 RepID=A0A0B2QBZ7_GLYSO|nr:hypothetical protein glysoja_045792 [Glycine soja]
MTSLTIQMARWLKKEAVWRYVGFVSTIVGLLCYGLSSSFNSLFGEWSLLKIFLYSVFSLFICLSSLFPKVWQYSTSLRLKAHLAFLVLTVTSVYSYFADKVVNRKPDAYSLISSAAFAIGDGLEKECCDVYCNWQRESLEECLINLFEMQEINVKQKWEEKQLEEYIIRRWIKALKVIGMRKYSRSTTQGFCLTESVRDC